MNQNQQAFLDTIATSELTEVLLKNSDNGYNVLVGSTGDHPLLFDDYSDHPRIFNKELDSTAAGRYQILEHNYDYYKKFLGLPDFRPVSQDAIALQLIKECHAIDNINAGNLHIAIAQCSRIWASLPGNSYHQHENTYDQLSQIYLSAGGAIA